MLFNKMKIYIMRNAILIFMIIIILLLSGCIGISTISKTSGINIGQLNSIPAKSKIVLVSKANTSADSLYDELFSILLSRSHRIYKDDKTRHYITTEGKDVGESTLQRMTIVITETESSSRAKITTEWKAGADAAALGSAISGIAYQAGWAQVYWEASRLGIAFAESVAIAIEIKEGKVSYE